MIVKIRTIVVTDKEAWYNGWSGRAGDFTPPPKVCTWGGIDLILAGNCIKLFSIYTSIGLIFEWLIGPNKVGKESIY
jgi:hypothetical protein